jgi:hypothetical protein
MPRISSLLRTTHCVVRGALLPGLLALQICQGAVTSEIATFDVPGYEGATVLVGVNHLGDMVGGVGPRGKTTGFIRLHTGQLTPITIPGAYETVAEGINDDGVVVGFYVLESGAAFGFLRATDGTISAYETRRLALIV